MYDFGKLNGIRSLASSAMKTPYQLDLEVKGRKPDIVPKVGDKVKIKSREWYEKWKNEEGNIDGIGTHSFLLGMSKYCGKVFKVDYTICSVFTLEDVHFGWIMSMFEEVYPQESSKEEKCAKSLYSSSISASALTTQLTGTSAIPALNSVQGISIPYDLGTLSRQGAGLEAWPYTSPRTNLPQSCFGRISAVVHQDFLKKEEPELQTIKKHRFIKLEKL
ncbi:MAG: hypothetical protein IJ456_05410 [Bacteroides sp.]|nr:hypothetical protein [Bacteroides sp.]